MGDLSVTPGRSDRWSATLARMLGRAARRLRRAGRWLRAGVLRPGLLRRMGRWVLVGLAVVVPAMAWGVATASAPGNLGPHTARYQVTLDSEITVDLGPLGTVVIDSPLPLVLGARVVVQEIPRELTSVGASTTLDALEADLEAYIQLFTGPEATLEVAARAVVLDAVRRAAIAVVVITGVVLLLRVTLGERRRAELRVTIRPHCWAIAAVAGIFALVGGMVTSSTPLSPEPSADRMASAVFDGTPLAGARITGRLAGVIDTYGGYAVDAYKDNQAFYAAATDAVRVAWADRAARDERLVGSGGTSGARWAAGQPAAAPQEPSAPGSTADRGAAHDPAAADQPAAEPVVMLVVSDLHCNIGMAEVIRAVAELSGAEVILNAGDTTVNGTSVESYCVTAFADAVPEGATMVVVNGNHDSTETLAQARGAGMRVLDGEVVEIAGIRMLGDSDPRATRIGVGTTLVGEETVADLSGRLAEVACDDTEGVDLLLVHDPNAGDDALAEGCVPAQVSGHLHRRIGPLWLGHGTRYVSSSTAGARLGEPTIGPLTGVAELTVLRFDPDSGRILDYRLVRILPNASATVAVALDWPGERPGPVPDSPFR